MQMMIETMTRTVTTMALENYWLELFSCEHGKGLKLGMKRLGLCNWLSVSLHMWLRLHWLGQHLRTRVTDLVDCATSQANDIHGAVRESCIIRDAEGRGRRKKATLTIKVKHLQGRVLPQSLAQLLRSFVPDLVTCATSQASDIRGVVR